MGNDSDELRCLQDSIAALDLRVKELEKSRKSWWQGLRQGLLQEYNFLVIVLGCAFIVGLSALALITFHDLFKQAPELTAALGLAFGAIVGLIGTYFGIKESHEARQEAHSLAQQAVGSNNSGGGAKPSSEDGNSGRLLAASPQEPSEVEATEGAEPVEEASEGAEPRSGTDEPQTSAQGRPSWWRRWWRRWWCWWCRIFGG
jgi:hypothetical protein